MFGPNCLDGTNSHGMPQKKCQSFQHIEKYFRNIIKSNRNQIVFTIFQLTWRQSDVRLVPNQSENGNYNLILGSFNKISKKILYVYKKNYLRILRSDLFWKQNVYSVLKIKYDFLEFDDYSLSGKLMKNQCFLQFSCTF